ncbi:hypothetical protein S40293_04818 [Stachybotrys chartarum IBT 40293]|nr:hypothetical protein S40293_04818 [Stachybotrys chartarum IBT 40293]
MENSDIDSDDIPPDDRSSCSLGSVTDDSDDEMDEAPTDVPLLCNLNLPDVKTVEAEMARISMDDDEDILARVRKVITAREQSRFSFTATDEINLDMSQNSENLELRLTNILNKDQAISEAVERYRNRLYRLITRIAQFMLAVGDRCQSAIPREWYLVIIANASAENRQRLVRIITCPGVQPVALQYLLEQRNWPVDLFDGYHHIGLKNCDATGDFFTAYNGLAHCPDGIRFVYSGGVTSMTAEKDEVSRMIGHRKILALGHDEIKRRRASGEKGPIFIHSKMSSPGARSFFFPLTRFSVNPTASGSELVKMHLMTYLIENYNTIHLTGQWSSHSKMQLALRSHHPRSILRPVDFPHSRWLSGNVVLPLTQNFQTGCIQILGAAESTSLSSTDLRDSLQEHLLSDRDSIVSRALIDQVLME